MVFGPGSKDHKSINSILPEGLLSNLEYLALSQLRGPLQPADLGLAAGLAAAASAAIVCTIWMSMMSMMSMDVHDVYGCPWIPWMSMDVH